MSIRLLTEMLIKGMVETKGIEPPTLCVQGRCSTPELHPQTVLMIGSLYTFLQARSTNLFENLIFRLNFCSVPR